MNLFRTVLEFVVKDRASSGIKNVSSSLDRATKASAQAQKSFKNLAGAFVALVVAGRVKAVFESMIEPARKMEIAMQRLGYLSGATAEQLSKFKATALEVARVTKFGPVEATDAMVQLVKATGSAVDAQKMLGSATGLAQASFGKLSLEKSANMLATTSRAFSMTGEQATLAADKMMKATKVAGVGVEELKDIMGYLGAAATRGGQSMDEMLQGFVLARRALPSSRRSATQLMRAMGEITSDKAVDALGQIGVQTMDLEGNIRNFSSIMLDMSQAMTVAPLDVRDALNAAFGQAAVKPMLAILGQMHKGVRTMTGETLRGAEVFRFYGNEIDNSKGAIDEANKSYMQTAHAGIERLDQQFETLKMTLGTQLLPSLGYLAAGLSEVINAVIKFANEHPGLMKVIKAFMFMASASLVIVGLKMALVGMYQIMQGAKGVITSFALDLKKAALETGNLARATITAEAAKRGYLGTVKTSSMTLRAYAIHLKANDLAMMKFGMQVRSATGSFHGFNLQQRLLIRGMGIMPRVTAVAAASLRGLKLAAHGLKIAIKSLWGATGFGLIIAFLPEIIEGLKKVYGWVTENTGAWLAWAAQIKKTGGIMGWFLERMESMMGVNFENLSKLHAMSKELEKYKELQQRKKLLEEKAHYTRMQELMIFATKPFDKAVDKIEKLFGHKPQLIKASDIVLMKKELQKVLSTGAGGWMTTSTGEDIQITERHMKAARLGLEGTNEAMRLLDEARLGGRNLTGKEATRVATGFYRGHAGVRSTQPASKDLLERTAAPGMAFLHQLKSPSRNAEAAMRGLVGDLNVSTGRPSAPLDPMSLSGQRYYRFHSGGRKTLPAELGGAEGQHTGTKGGLLTGDAGALATGAGDMRTRAEIEGVTKKSAAEELKDLNGKMDKLITNINRIAREGVKVEDASDPKVKWKNQMSKAFGEAG